MHAVLHRVAVPLHRVAQPGEKIARGFAPGRCHHRVHAAVGHEDGGVGVGGCTLGHQGVGQRQVTRQGHDAGEPLGEAQAGVQGHGAALREARQHDVLVGDATRGLVFDQLANSARRQLDAGRVLAVQQVAAHDVVPRGHDVAAVQGDRDAGRVRKDEANGRAGVQVQLGYQGGEVVAIGPEAV